MELASNFSVASKHLTPAEALQLAADMENALGRILAGTLKPGNLDVGLLTGAVQALRDYVKTEPPLFAIPCRKYPLSEYDTPACASNCNCGPNGEPATTAVPEIEPSKAPSVDPRVIDMIAKLGGDNSESASLTLYRHRWKAIAAALRPHSA